MAIAPPLLPAGAAAYFGLPSACPPPGLLLPTPTAATVTPHLVRPFAAAHGRLCVRTRPASSTPSRPPVCQPSPASAFCCSPCALLLRPPLPCRWPCPSSAPRGPPSPLRARDARTPPHPALVVHELWLRTPEESHNACFFSPRSSRQKHTTCPPLLRKKTQGALCKFETFFDLLKPVVRVDFREL